MSLLALKILAIVLGVLAMVGATVAMIWVMKDRE